MILVVFGSRRLRNYRLVKQKLDSILRNVDPSTIIEWRSGCADGADKLGERYARDVLHIEPTLYPADWTNLTVPNAIIKTRRDGTQYNARAGIERNELMIVGRDGTKATHAIAFKPDYCESRGTDDMIERCKRHSINMRIVMFDKLHGGE
jgi:hypothetical protein